MMRPYERELNDIHQLNQVAKKHGVVLFGSTFAKNIPVGELLQDFDLDRDVYNRSIADLSVFDAGKILTDCVDALKPEKILLQLGETDLERGYKTIPEILDAYREIIKTLQADNRNSDIVLVSVCETGAGIYPETFNSALKTLAHETGCTYADITPALTADAPKIRAFGLLKRFIRDRMTTSDALALCF